MPLGQHDWAEKAAEAAACTALQDPRAFWLFHDAVFSKQKQISANTVDTQLEQIANAIPGLNVEEYTNCVARQLSLGAVTQGEKWPLPPGCPARRRPF